MATANFTTNLCGFPLYAREYAYSKRCPECGCWNNDDAEACDECGENLQGIEAEYDEFMTEDLYDEAAADAEELNRDLEFFSVSVASGYYTGFQFVVDMPQDDPENLDNDDCHYYYDRCRSKAIRACGVERRRLEKRLADVAARNGFEAYVAAARFSNGEVIYRKAENPLGLRRVPKKRTA